MSRSLLTVGVLGLVAFAVACGGSGQGPANPASPSLSAATGVPTDAGIAPAGQGGKMVARKIEGKLDGRFDFTRQWGSEWWEIYSDSTSAGTMTHLGLTRMRTTHVPRLDLTLDDGTFTIVAANGDEIQGTYEGQATYDPVRTDLAHGEATFLVTGGTGRFEHATGTFEVTFLEFFDDPSWASAGVSWTLSGTVTY